MNRIKNQKPHQKNHSENSVHSVKKIRRLVPLLLNWFAANARDLPWRRTRDPYAIWVSEIMLQQTQVKTVIPFWTAWLSELPTIESAANASADKIHKLWEGLGYYTRVRNLQKAARQIVENHDNKFPDKFNDILALPGIGRYTAGAICSIAFNQPTPILDGNVIRVLTRIFGIAENPKEKKTNARLWKLAEELVKVAQVSCRRGQAGSLPYFNGNCSALNQSLMELGALVCAPRNPQCLVCPVKNWCVAFKENLVDELPNLGKRESATARKFVAFVIKRDGKFLVRQRPAGIVNAHLWEFPNFEINGAKVNAKEIFKSQFGFLPAEIQPLCVIKHSITRYRITVEAFRVQLKGSPAKATGVWLSWGKFNSLAFTAAHKKLAGFAADCILSDR
ncbi:MAG TPA: A/G-specific adenine glycosylase [Verrucomicrobiae bacterium]|nr:A/G-specific adenine glycosylase [Verrucomicrobiae bacterium]